MTTATLNGVELFFDVVGDGLPFVMLHGGLGFDHTYLKSTFGPLEDVLRMIYVDQRNNGRSERGPIDAVTIPQLADDVEALRAHLGLDRIGVLGHSYGGFVALEYATRFPERVSHLVAVDTSPGAFEPTAEELAERADPSWITPEIEKAMSLFAAGMPATRDEFEAVLEDFVPIYLKKLAPRDLADLLAAGTIDPAMAAHSMQVLQGWSVNDKLGQITAPTLVVCGRYDLLTTPECSKRLSKSIPDAELVFLETSGHFPWLEEPDTFFAALESWLLRHRP
jgi:proline iminopeptidase